MAICAKEFKKPFYVLTESYKFSRMYPLNQKDLPNRFKVRRSTKNIIKITYDINIFNFY